MEFNVNPQPVAQADPTIVLDQNFANNAMAEMKRLGAKNVDPPLAPSTHLKNINTGVIFPWTAALAEHRDVLVNCDAEGNTDPAAWQRTVRKEQDMPDQAELMQQAYASLQKPQGFMQSAPKQVNEPAPMPYGAQTLDKFLDNNMSATPPEVTPKSVETLEQISQMM